MSSIDFNLENYDLNDILALFKLNYNFNLDELKEAKKLVLKTHPDKSGLDKEYFLFYCKAFRIIKKIYDVKNKKEECLDREKSKMNYKIEEEEKWGDKILIENLLKKDKKEFNIWFNKTFDKINIIEEERKNGYGNWFKTDEDIDSTETSFYMMHQKINDKKKSMSSLIKRNNINELCSNNSFQQIDGTAPSSYQSGIFSKLSFEDLKVAHTETVIPVSEDDFKNMKKFNNLENLRNYRNKQNINPLSENDSKKYFNNKNNLEEMENLQVAYKLAKQEEQIERANKKWWANLRLLN